MIGGQFGHGIDGVLLTATANHPLGDQNGQADQCHTGQIDQNESGATAVAHHVREAPDIAQANGGARRGQHKAHTR